MSWMSVVEDGRRRYPSCGEGDLPVPLIAFTGLMSIRNAKCRAHSIASAERRWTSIKESQICGDVIVMQPSGRKPYSRKDRHELNINVVPEELKRGGGELRRAK